MESLVRHLITPIVAHPDEVGVTATEGDASVMLELDVNPEDRDRVRGDKGRTLRAVRSVLSAAAGRRKASVELAGDDDEGDAEGSTDDGEAAE